MKLLSFIRRNARYQRESLYLCDCGATVVALEYNVRSGHTKSCGCKTSSLISAARLTHGETRPRSPEYRIWSGMKSRCLNPKSSCYANYGGRGIRVHPEWIDSYENFLAYMGRRPSRAHSLERENNDGNYEPGNVEWALPKQQARNRRSSRIIEFNGKRQCLQAWADDLGINQSSLFERLEKWPVGRALTQRGMS